MKIKVGEDYITVENENVTDNPPYVLMEKNSAELLVELTKATEALLYMMGEYKFDSNGETTIETAINKAKKIILKLNKINKNNK